MRTRRDVLVMAAGVAATGGFAGMALARDASLDEVIRRHTIAMGGAKALDKVHAKRVTLRIEEKGQPLDAIYQCNADPAWRIDIFIAGKHVFCEGLDARGPWLWPGGADAAKDAVPDARRTGLQGVEFHIYGLHRFVERGHHLALDAPQTIDGKTYHVVRVTMRDAYETFLFINPATWLIDRRRDERAPHPDVDAKRKSLEKRFLNYRPVDGIMTAFREDQIDLVNGAVINTSVVQSVEHNHRYPAGTFDRAFVAA